MSGLLSTRQRPATDPAAKLAVRDLQQPLQQDELTGFTTQSYFEERLDRLIQVRAFTSTPLTLALLQLANFYEISSWVGGQEARQLLTRLARLLEDTVPTNSWLCRCRHHEFALLLIGEGSRRFTEIAESIHQVLRSQSKDLVPPQLSLACGIGSVAVGVETPNCAVAFARARHAIWQSQLNSVQDLPALADNPDQELARRLDSALAEDRLQLNYQGILGFRGDVVRRYEARATLIEGNACQPARLFMDAAVKNAQAEQLDRRVCEAVVKLLLSAAGQSCQLVVNLSQNSLVSPQFLDWLASRLSASLAGRLVLQVSELDILITQHHLDRFCVQAKALNLGLHINHFGASEDPFRYLALFPADAVKLHRSRLQQLTESSARRQQLTELVETLHSKGIQVIAPNVEKFSDLPLLWNTGVDFVQGHSLHRPSRRLDCEFVEEVELTLG